MADPDTSKAPDDRLWTPADLGQFLGMAPSTLIRLASSHPERLPPRVAALRMLRWVPEVCREWVLTQCRVTAPQRRVGRPRNRAA